ncbi:MAG: calcium-translocating P-type ATPase, PMCA-type [Clostridia bacterium]|nr:calcium-translocating P-type ATPase, PMCA-type [Clostridia bacterium]
MNMIMTEKAKRRDTQNENTLRPLNADEVESSRRTHGANTLSVRKGTPFYKKFVSNLGDPVIKVLIFALIINLLFSFRGGDWVESCGIAAAVLLATLISTLSEQGSEAAFAKLSEQCTKTSVRILRRMSGHTSSVCELPDSEVVVGDILLVGAGEMIPADGVLMEGTVKVDQSSMTGENREIRKTPLSADTSADSVKLSPAEPYALLRGCTVLSGSGKMQVTAVGDSTLLGEISHELQEDKRESPLKVRLTRLAKQISRLGYVAAALVALVYLANSFIFDSGFDKALILARLTDIPFLFSEIFDAITLALTVIVVAVPEGLPMMIAVVLSSNIKKMVRDRVLVRKPTGIEAAGSMNILFTDKTGTLTEGKVSLDKIILGDGEILGSISALCSKQPDTASALIRSCVLNTESAAGYSAERSGLCAIGGNSTDRALLDAVIRAGKAFAPTQRQFSVPFDSEFKFSACVTDRLYVKGAAEKLLPYVTSYLCADGQKTLDKLNFQKQLSEFTARGIRVLLIAQSQAVPARTDIKNGDFGELTLICAVTLEDKLRKEAKRSVRQLQGAGIQVVMVTGDNKDTASSIAKKCGIINDSATMVITGRELAAMDDDTLRKALPKIGVIARALPSDKSRLVRIAQQSDLVVGMTGDGINDAPALRHADIGFAMGAGTQVAKEAGDIIILDNNLSSIARAVLYGRTVFKSIRKFITLQLMMNFCAVCVTMICPFIGIDEPVTVVQMLWLNLIMDTLGGLAFAGEAPLESYMKEPPKRRDEPILNGYMIHEIILTGVFTVIMCLLFLKSPAITANFRTSDDNIYLLTAFFALFIFASVFNCFNARTDRLNTLSGLTKNKAFMGIMAAVLAVQIIFVYLGGAVLRTAPLTAHELMTALGLALTVIPAEFIRKLLWKLGDKKEKY